MANLKLARISDLIAALQKIQEEHGDLIVVAPIYYSEKEAAAQDISELLDVRKDASICGKVISINGGF